LGRKSEHGMKMIAIKAFMTGFDVSSL